MTQTDFNTMYWLHQPPEVRALKDLTPGEVLSRAIELAMKGFIIDKPIVVDGWDPYQTMRLRILYGFTWTPSLLQQPVSIAPGLSGTAGTAYDPLHPPAGSIKVSIEPEDYPAFDPPVPIPPTNTASPVGAFLYTVDKYGDMYANLPWDKTRDGDLVENDPRGIFVKHFIQSPFSPFGWGYFTPKK